ncbi:hypothetical protein C4D60_Mb11t06360 [Musa balbisiana]|uniref:Uncharacterized protein n=1 Tax=Musa balbisiana TaxID=52838 RepID=A0A4S8J284_MUSBA|nr:hypothetical protein C4D60_Mb11t06360 [Musa balbisiana]
MNQQGLDCVLMPAGLTIMLAYHLWLLRRIAKHPTKTVIGVNAINRRHWVHTMTVASAGNGSSSKHSRQDLVLGDRSKLGLSVKLFSILVCFAFALLLNIEAVRYYSHVRILINVPLRGRRSPAHLDTVMNKGSYFWSGGLHAFYLSLPFFLWIFGPISMVIRRLLLVCFL